MSEPDEGQQLMESMGHEFPVSGLAILLPPPTIAHLIQTAQSAPVIVQLTFGKGLVFMKLI